jgi:2-keto-4-pentenoate hydratase/2-oxohepta-3-ene-1,7-dioic acid hydratase in catechol pathway
MRFGTLNIDGRATAVIVSDDGQQYREVADLVPGFNGDMTDFIARMPVPPKDAGKAGAWKAIAGNKVLAPIPTPRRNIFCVGKNYHEHAKEFANSGLDRKSVV